MIGVVAERFPRGGALSLNMVTAVGQLSVGIIGTVFLGLSQDIKIEQNLKAHYPEIHQEVIVEKSGFFGSYEVVNPELRKNLPVKQEQEIKGIEEIAKKDALRIVAILPLIMLVCYLLLMFYYKKKGGYSEINLTEKL